jgi:hypothetical protein
MSNVAIAAWAILLSASVQASAFEPDVQGVSGSEGANAPAPSPTSSRADHSGTDSQVPDNTLPADAANVAPHAASQSDEIAKLKEEMAQLRSEFETTRASTDAPDAYQRTIDLYGFMDMGFQKLWLPAQSAFLGTGTSGASTFVLGNVNLYVDANPTQNWRVLTEARFTNYPNGTIEQLSVPALNQTEKRTTTAAYDVNAPDPGWNSVNWGSIVLQQAWIQGTFTDWLGVRVGYWLTPFGIWNIDHGTPTLIGLTAPSFTGGKFYPRNQLGIQAIGHVTSGTWTFNYTGYVSNGKTPDQLDPTGDKAFGLRLSAQTMRPFPLQFGLAGYTGRYSNIEHVGVPPLNIATKETVAYRQWDIGADISLDINAFRFRTEFAIERVDYDPGKYELSWGVPGYYTPNHLSWGWFSIAAYRLPWLGLEPYLSCELYRYPTPLSEDIATPGVGLNIHVNTEVQIKTQYTRAYFFDFNGEHDHSSQNLSMLASRLVVAY